MPSRQQAVRRRADQRRRHPARDPDLEQRAAGQAQRRRPGRPVRVRGHDVDQAVGDQLPRRGACLLAVVAGQRQRVELGERARRASSARSPAAPSRLASALRSGCATSTPKPRSRSSAVASWKSVADAVERGLDQHPARAPTVPAPAAPARSGAAGPPARGPARRRSGPPAGCAPPRALKRSSQHAGMDLDGVGEAEVRRARGG